jgi:CYTH domain-containing protein
MAVEIERKFLVDKKNWEKVVKPMGSYYKQGYILTEPEKTIRIRINADEAFLTIKGKTENFSRSEFEFSIPLKDAEEMLKIFAGNVIEKVRYKIKYEGKLWEVDVFREDNYGLILAEIELQNEDEEFTVPEWVLKEVTGDERYYNSYLSKHPYKEFKDQVCIPQ